MFNPPEVQQVVVEHIIKNEAQPSPNYIMVIDFLRGKTKATAKVSRPGDMVSLGGAHVSGHSSY